MRGRGRGIAEIIEHLSHLTPLGWCYLGGVLLLSLVTWQASKKVIPYIIRERARKYYPNFEWIVIPHGFPISGLLFLCLCFPLGYFCNRVDNDILFFKFMSVFLLLLTIMPVFFKLYKQKCFMRNNQSLFISSFALLGFYRRIKIHKDSIKTFMSGSKNEKLYIEFTVNNGERILIDTTNYSDEGRKILLRLFRMT